MSSQFIFFIIERLFFQEGNNMSLPYFKTFRDSPSSVRCILKSLVRFSNPFNYFWPLSSIIRLFFCQPPPCIHIHTEIHTLGSQCGALSRDPDMPCSFLLPYFTYAIFYNGMPLTILSFKTQKSSPLWNLPSFSSKVKYALSVFPSTLFLA